MAEKKRNSRLQIEFERIVNVVLKALQMSHILTSAIRLRQLLINELIFTES